MFATGDVNGKAMLAHTAYREAELCVNLMLGHDDRMNYDAKPSVIYTHPEVAGVGLTAEAARLRGSMWTPWSCRCGFRPLCCGEPFRQ